MIEPALTIVVGTLDRHESIKQCIKSVLEFTDIPYELIIADAGNRPIALNPHPPNIKLLREWPRQGHAKGFNKAFRQASGKYVCWLNDDARCTPGWARNAVAFMEQNAAWVGMGAFYYSEHGCCYHVNEYKDMIYANFGILSRKFGDDIGWFDEVVRMYGADNSITFKTILAGKAVAGMPNARLIHLPVHDQQRVENMAGQKTDEQKLLQVYGPYIPQMQQMMAKFPPTPIHVN